MNLVRAMGMTEEDVCDLLHPLEVKVSFKLATNEKSDEKYLDAFPVLKDQVRRQYQVPFHHLVPIAGDEVDDMYGGVQH
jgi:hypothetical protein